MHYRQQALTHVGTLRIQTAQRTKICDSGILHLVLTVHYVNMLCLPGNVSEPPPTWRKVPIDIAVSPKQLVFYDAVAQRLPGRRRPMISAGERVRTSLVGPRIPRTGSSRPGAAAG